MKRAFVAALIAGAACFASALPAFAASYVQDGGGMFSSSTVASLDSRIDSFHSQTGKEIVVVTVPSLNGQSYQQAADSAFQQQNVNGVLIFIAKNEHKDDFVLGRNEVNSATITPANIVPIRSAMESQFKAGDFDGGISNAVDSLLGLYRSHEGSLNQQTAPVSRGYSTSYARTGSSGVHFNMVWVIVAIVIGFLLLRSVFRSFGGGPRYYGGGPMGGGPGYYGGGPGYYGGGGGGFWSGLLGGLGGAWLGNELFGGNRTIVDQQGGNFVDTSGGNAGAPDSGMWQNDAGQIGGDSGGDFGSGGFSDVGGGGVGGGDSGGGFGGGGDSGGGW